MFGFRKAPGRIDVGEAVGRTGPDGDAVLLDVREHEEWAAGHAPGAVLLPLSALGGGADLPDEARDRPVVVICRAGHRSQRAAAILRDRGVEAVDVIGGMIDWAHAGHPVVDDSGESGWVA